MTDKTFQMIVRVGAILVAISVLGNAWLVLRHWELSKRLAASTPEMQQRVQELGMRQQTMQGLLQEVLARTQNNPQVVQILQRHGLISVAPSAPPVPRP